MYPTNQNGQVRTVDDRPGADAPRTKPTARGRTAAFIIYVLCDIRGGAMSDMRMSRTFHVPPAADVPLSFFLTCFCSRAGKKKQKKPHGWGWEWAGRLRRRSAAAERGRRRQNNSRASSGIDNIGASSWSSSSPSSSSSSGLALRFSDPGLIATGGQFPGEVLLGIPVPGRGRFYELGYLRCLGFGSGCLRWGSAPRVEDQPRGRIRQGFVPDAVVVVFPLAIYRSRWVFQLLGEESACVVQARGPYPALRGL